MGCTPSALYGLLIVGLLYRVLFCNLLLLCAARLVRLCSAVQGFLVWAADGMHSVLFLCAAWLVCYCRVLFCGLLFLCANVLKKLLAKLFSSHFYKATHYDKMQDALRKEFFIVALSQPREDREEDDPMKHKPSTLAELRTKSFAAGGALVRPLTCLVVTRSQ